MSFEIIDLSFSYGSRKILDKISFTALPNQFVCILGPNGVGKTTLFRCMLGLNMDFDGSAKIDEHDIRDMTAAELAKQIAYIPQSHAPAFNYSVLDMVLMGTASGLSVFGSPGKRETAIAEASLEQMGIVDLRDRGYMQVSGGERQLVLIARAIAQRAKILIMDEPTAHLDYGNQIRVMERIRFLVKDGYTVIQSTHHPDQAFLYADRVLAMLGGKVLAFGTPGKIITSELMRSLYSVDVEMHSLYSDRVRVCIPKRLVEDIKNGGIREL